jgi:hypothetical protein
MKIRAFSVIASLLICHGSLFSQESSEAEVANEDDPFAIPRMEAQQVEVLVNEKRIPLRSTPLYTYDEKVRNWNTGTTWIWGAEGRPYVVLNLSTYKRYRYIEFTSFSNEQITVSVSDGEVWKPKPNWDPTLIPDAPKPAAARSSRLIQMRAMAKRFSASQFEDSGESYELRLLPQPIYRYKKESKASADGAFFAFVRESDLEIILVIDAVKNDKGETQWYFDCRPVALNKQEVQLENTVVWAHERNELNSSTGPYRLFGRVVAPQQ